MRINLEPAFILHTRPYRETSFLLEVFAKEHGRISLIARGARKHKSKSLLQPFIPLLLSWQGKSELMTLQTIEPQTGFGRLKGDGLLSGFYLNELLMRLLQKHDPYPQLYTIYHHTLLKLAQMPFQEEVLRLFEKKLLEELGYGLQLRHDVQNGEPLVAERFYRFYPEQGFIRSERWSEDISPLLFSGKSLLALAEEQWTDKELLKEAKRLMRAALLAILGSKPLHSRKLFIEVIE